MSEMKASTMTTRTPPWPNKTITFLGKFRKTYFGQWLRLSG